MRVLTKALKSCFWSNKPEGRHGFPWRRVNLTTVLSLSFLLAAAGCTYAPSADQPTKSAPLNGTTTVHLAGDSTLSEKELKDYPETGWGVPFAVFFEPSITVVNHAKNGRSTRTFLEEGRWDTILTNLNAGDYVFIQFGHNDESEHKKDRYTTPEEYQANLSRFIRDVRSKHAEPILLSPITRRYFNSDGSIKETHPYAPLCRSVAQNESVTFLDMEAITREYFQELGEELSALRFMHIPAGLHPNYPNGVRDDTHLNQMGAREVAQLVLAELRKQHHPLTKRLRTPDPKHLRLSY